MNILIVTHCFPANKNDFRGVFFPDFIQQLHKLGHKVFVLTQDKALNKDNRPYDVIWFPWRGESTPLGQLSLKKPSNCFALFSYLRNIKKAAGRLVREEKIDFCLSMWAFPGGLCAKSLKRKFNIPYAVWCLGSDIWTYAKMPVAKKIIKNILLEADIVYADGYELSSDVVQLTGKDCTFLPTTRDLPSESNIPVEIIKGAANILFIGRLEAIKGVDVLLRAASQLVRSGLNFHLHIFGAGPMADELKKESRDLMLESNVTFHGIADAATASAYLKASDCLVIPSRVESIPVIFSDGLKNDIPLVVTDVGDMGALNSKYKAGRTVPSEDVNALKNAILETVRESRDTFKSGRQKLAEVFNYEKVARKFILDVSKIIGEET